MRFCRNALVALISFAAPVVTLGIPATASAACRDDCYASCGTDTKCLVPCLKACGGDNVPPVPAPKPAPKPKK
jgi:hypothetical protein